MAEYFISGMISSQPYYLSLDSTSFPFTDEDAFEFADFLETRGYIDASTVQINKRPYWALNIPDPR